MDKDKNSKSPSFDVLDTTANILGQHGKSEAEIKEFLEKQFPISTAILEKIMEARKKKNSSSGKEV